MIEHLSYFTSVKAEVGMGEVDAANDSHKDEQPWVVALTLGFKWIISELVTIGQVMHISLLLKVVPVGVR